MSFTVPQMIPDATYRIRTGSDPALYFQIDGSTGDVVPKALDTTLDTQKWNFKNNTGDNMWILTNFGTKTQLSIKDSGEKDDNGSVIYKLATFDAGLSWTVESRGLNFVIGLASDNTCIDFSAGVELLVWARNNLDNQRFILEQIPGTTVPPTLPITPTPGEIRLYNASNVNMDGWISNTTNPSDTQKWYAMPPGSYLSRPRSGEESASMRVQGGPAGEPDALTASVVAIPGSVTVFHALYSHPGMVVGK